MTAPFTPAAPSEPDVQPTDAEREEKRRALLSIVFTIATATLAPIVIVLVPAILSIILVPAVLVAEAIYFIRHRRGQLLAVRLALGFAVVTAAHLAPIKPIDVIVMSNLPTESMTISEYNKHNRESGLKSYLISPEDDLRLVRFSRADLPLRAFIGELDTQLHSSVHVGYCGTGASILFGASPMGHSVWLSE